VPEEGNNETTEQQKYKNHRHDHPRSDRRHLLGHKSHVASYYQLLNHQLKPHLLATLIKKYPPRRSWTIGLPPALLMKAIDA
jgi:hypothetical protein